jgi:heptose I phosphotransferase
VRNTEYRRTEVSDALGGTALLTWAAGCVIAAPEAHIYRAREGRTTLLVTLAERRYFLKYHSGVGWREIAKNLLQWRLPVLDASNEYAAIERLRGAGIDTLSIAAFALAGQNPATRRSVLLTDALLETCSLETLCKDWPATAPPPALRLHLLRTVAQMVKGMHAAGVNHRDLYLCHILIPQPLVDLHPPCTLIDLHRAQCRSATPYRWRRKDLAALYFSALEIGLRTRDLQRFMHHYHGSLRKALTEHGDLWRSVARRAHKMRARELRRRARGTPP